MKIHDYDKVSELHPNDLIIIDGDRGTKAIPAKYLYDLGGSLNDVVEKKIQKIAHEYQVRDTTNWTTDFASFDEITEEKTSSGFTGYKNIAKWPYIRATGYKKNGVTFDVLADGSIKMNGKASGDTSSTTVYEISYCNLKTAKYTVVCEVLSGTVSRNLFLDVHGGSPSYNGDNCKIDNNVGVIKKEITVPNNVTNCIFRIVITGTTIFNEYTIRPMLCLSEDSSEDPFVMPSTIPTLELEDKHKTVFGKISAMFKNVRKLWNTVGTEQIPAELGTSVTGALQNVPFRFGIDSEGNYGYKKVGADTVTPFRTDPKIVLIGSSSDDASYNVTGYKGWQKFKTSNFFLVASGISCYVPDVSAQTAATYNGDYAMAFVTGGSNTISPSVTYDASSGIVKVSGIRKRGNIKSRLRAEYKSDVVTQASDNTSFTVTCSLSWKLYLVY